MTQILEGTFDQAGHPHFKMELFGFNRNYKIEINPMFDSGFTGFLNLPLVLCLQTGLILYSTSTYTLADGRASSTILCMGTIVIPNKNVIGTVSIDFNTNDALLGMDFIRKLKGKFHMDIENNRVWVEYAKSTQPPSKLNQ